MSHIYRIRDEKDEIDTRIEKLRAFIWDDNQIFKELSMVDVDLLITQLHTMRQYSEILGKRLARGQQGAGADGEGEP